MSAKQMGWAITRQTANPLAKLILVVLANRSDAQGFSFMAQATIAKQAGVDRKTVNRMLKLLEAEGHIRRLVRRTANGFRTSDHIQISPTPRCTSQVLTPVPEVPSIPSSPYGVLEEGEEEGLGVEVPSTDGSQGTEA